MFPLDFLAVVVMMVSFDARFEPRDVVSCSSTRFSSTDC